MQAQTGVERIAAERQRQKTKEHFTAKHDDEHIDGELARAAACYAAPVQIYEQRNYQDRVVFLDPWPYRWDACWDKRVDPAACTKEQRIDLLTKAGALVAAEIDRLLRLK